MREEEEKRMREEEEKKKREEEKKMREEEEKKMREEEEKRVREEEEKKMREEEERMRQEEEKKMREEDDKKELDEEKRSIVKNEKEKRSQRRDESDDEEKRDAGSDNEDEDLKMAYNPFDNFPRTSFLKLIKNSGAESIATPVVDTIRDISLDFLNYMFDMLTEMKSQIESSDVKHFIELFVEDFNELPETVVLSSSIFERCILEICNQRKIKIKRDAVATTHELLELVLQKVIKGAVLIADNSRRRRVTEREIEIAYEIYMS